MVNCKRNNERKNTRLNKIIGVLSNAENGLQVWLSRLILIEWEIPLTQNYIASEGANILYYHQLSIARYQDKFLCLQLFWVFTNSVHGL